MREYCQGDIIKISGYKGKLFVIVSKNAFIKATGVFHVSPVIQGIAEGPIHIRIKSKKGEMGTVICEQIKMIDPNIRVCNCVDSLHYNDVMDISDVIQGIFEYD